MYNTGLVETWNMHHLSLSNCFILYHSSPKIPWIIHVLVKRLKDREVPTSVQEDRGNRIRKDWKQPMTKLTFTISKLYSINLSISQKLTTNYNKLSKMYMFQCWIWWMVWPEPRRMWRSICEGSSGQLWTFWNLWSVKLLEVICQQEFQFWGTFYPLSNLSSETRKNKRLWLSLFAEPCSSRLLACSFVWTLLHLAFTNTSPSNGHVRGKLRSVLVLSRTEWRVFRATAAMVAGYNSKCSKCDMMRFYHAHSSLATFQARG